MLPARSSKWREENQGQPWTATLPTLQLLCDARMDEAIEWLRSRQQPDGTWLLENTHPGKVHFALEDGDGRPSRWNTLRGLRVLCWYEQSGSIAGPFNASRLLGRPLSL